MKKYWLYMSLDLVRECKFCSGARAFNDKLRVVVMVNDVDILVTIYFVSCSIFIENENYDTSKLTNLQTNYFDL